MSNPENLPAVIGMIAAICTFGFYFLQIIIYHSYHYVTMGDNRRNSWEMKKDKWDSYTGRSHMVVDPVIYCITHLLGLPVAAFFIFTISTVIWIYISPMLIIICVIFPILLKLARKSYEVKKALQTHINNKSTHN